MFFFHFVAIFFPVCFTLLRRPNSMDRIHESGKRVVWGDKGERRDKGPNPGERMEAVDERMCLSGKMVRSYFSVANRLVSSRCKRDLKQFATDIPKRCCDVRIALNSMRGFEWIRLNVGVVVKARYPKTWKRMLFLIENTFWAMFKSEKETVAALLSLSKE